MKLWILEPVYNSEGNPWQMHYGKARCIIVRANDETSARKVAHNDSKGDFADNKGGMKTPFLLEKYSSCKEIPSEGEEEVILVDYYSE